MEIDFDNQQPIENPTSAAAVVGRLTGRYFLTLAAIVVLIALDQIAIQPFVSRLSKFAPAINVAGRQRMLSQKLTKAALALQISNDEAQRRARLAELSETLDQWSNAHDALRYGSSEIGVCRIQTSDIEREWQLLEPHFQAIRSAALAIVRSPHDIGSDRWKSDTAKVVAHEPAFLAAMDRIVKLMENEAAGAIFGLRLCAWGIAAAVVGLVVALGWIVIRPATRTIRRQVDELENRVADRTKALSLALESLQREITNLEAAEFKNQRLAAELAHAARVTTLGHFAAGLAHELNQPLATVVNYLEACDVELDQHPNADWSVRLRKNLARGKNAAIRAGRILGRMRNFVRPDLPSAAQIEIDTLIREVVEFCQVDLDHAGVTLTLDLTDEHAVVCVDPIQIQQVLVNLVQNALHAVRQCPADERSIIIRASTSNDSIQIAVVDSGPGFEGPDLESIFTPFNTTKPDGLGIGLSICREIVEQHGGAIWPEAAPGRGACVSFTLPRVINLESNVGNTRMSTECVCG